MTIQIGDRLPDVPLAIATSDGPQPTTSGEFFKGKRVALFAVPGAFTPTCSARHLPSYVEKAGELKGKGVDEIACISVNDPFVMGAWNKARRFRGHHHAGRRQRRLRQGRRAWRWTAASSAWASAASAIR